jgi:hypothetical protein
VWTPLPPVQWDAADGPAWFSCGDGNTVVCVRPEGDDAHLSVRRVTGFDKDTGAPAANERILEQTIALGPRDRKRYRLYPPDTDTIRLFLLVHARPAGIAGALDVEVIQQTVDPDIPNTARFMEPVNPADRHWFKREKIKASWAGRHPVRGPLSGPPGRETFGPATPMPPKPRTTSAGPRLDVNPELGTERELPGL